MDIWTVVVFGLRTGYFSPVACTPQPGSECVFVYSVLLTCFYCESLSFSLSSLWDVLHTLTTDIAILSLALTTLLVPTCLPPSAEEGSHIHHPTPFGDE